MSSRPSLGDRSTSGDTIRSRTSPRVEHFDGEIPPALSPLDAFAARGRLLARQLDESKRQDQRMSRLPPSSVERSLSQPRPNYFRAKSSGESISRQPTQRANPELEEPNFRPQSEYPRLSSVSNATGEYDYAEDQDATPRHEPTILRSGADDLEMSRVESPEEDLSLHVDADNGQHPVDAPFGMVLNDPCRNSSTDSAARLMIPRTLAPPYGSSRVVHTESSDDDYSSSNAGSTFSKPRKLSSGSAVSLPQSPMSSAVRPRARSPSMSSETSNSGAHLPRPSFNFSRPISRSSTSLSAPVPAAHPEQTPPTDQAGDMTRTNNPGPIGLPSPSDMAAQPPGDGVSPGAPSYIYAKYPLPRGRGVPRDSMVFSGLQTPHFEWQEPLFESTTPPTTSGRERAVRTPSPAPTGHESVRSRQANIAYGSPKSELQHLTPEATPQRNPSPDTGGAEQIPTPKSYPPTPNRNEKDDTISSADSASTIRPQTGRSGAPSTVISAEDHLAMGIDSHEKGSLKESTYHLRVAAKQNHPTAMLLYALACRHGWGMRPNQREGVQWLRKALDCVGIELMDESDSPGSLRAKELQKAYRAQFALSVYELGVSHLNGWGIEQDKALALRCFEIAGEWGDVDAMAEAGFCYAEGVGCKKDLKKAAKFYRMAEAKGMSMVGNSWYALG